MEKVFTQEPRPFRAPPPPSSARKYIGEAAAFGNILWRRQFTCTWQPLPTRADWRWDVVESIFCKINGGPVGVDSIGMKREVV
jgi:hypothetical protein